MQSFILPLSILTTISLTVASPLHPRRGLIQWGPCETIDNIDVPLTCATLPVPRDYTNSTSTETIDLKLVKFKAAKEPFKGSILFNPGGPGFAGRNILSSGGPTLQAFLGGQHDIISWDFRGTGDTLPFSCFPSEEERAAYYAKITASATNASDAAIGDAWATQKWLTEYCMESVNATAVGELIGTVATARDMMQIVDALGEDGLLRYWGVSYGSALGETVAAMFPDRMDKLVLDAVTNPTEWWEGRSISQVSATDATFDDFLAECLKAPDLCALAAHDRPDISLSEQMYQLFEDVKYNPVVLGTLGLQTYGIMKNVILGALYEPVANYHWLSVYLDAMLTRNETQFVEYLKLTTAGKPSQMPFPDFSALSAKENTLGIRCSDEELRANDVDSLMSLVHEWYEESRLAGDVVSTAVQTLACAQWPFKAKERYDGTFESVRTKNPILFVGNTFDPITSLKAAQNATAAFVDSRLLVNDGRGHGLIAQPSLCTAKALQRYFIDGVLPEEGTVCPPSIPAFTTESLSDVVEQMSSDP